MTVVQMELQLKQLASVYYTRLEDQLYDPEESVDGYDKTHQERHVIGLLYQLGCDAVSLVAARFLGRIQCVEADDSPTST